MRGVRTFAVVAGSALAALSPLDAAAWGGAADAGALPVASLALRAAAAALLLLGAPFIFWCWRRREAALGRDCPPTPASEIDGEWLEQNVFSLSPELVGAAYDGRVAGPEVAAVLARLCGQSKLASRVAAGARGWNNLELWLLVDRAELGGYERDLVDQLFGARNTTSGDLLRQQHGSAGFDPAAVLRGPVSAAADAALGVRRPRRWPLALGAALGVCLIMAAGASSALPVLLAAALGALGPLSAAVFLAPRYRRDATRSTRGARPCVAAVGASVAALALLIAAVPSLSPLAPFALAGGGLLGAALVARAAATRESPGGLRTRRHLLAARRFLAGELERPEPRVPDEWLPYLIALELSAEVERWYQAFGRIETAARKQRLAQRSESTEGADAAPRWTGGAGALGGIGPGGPWIVAAAGLTVAPTRERRGLDAIPARGLQLKQA